MSVQPPLVPGRFCHFWMVPVYPDKVRFPVEEPYTIGFVPVMLPATEVGSTIQLTVTRSE